MARKVCQTVQGTSTCCQAAMSGMLNSPLQIMTRSGSTRCGVCTIVSSRSKKHPGKPVFQFHWLPSGTRLANGQPCGTSSSSCAAAYASSGYQGGFLPPMVRQMFGPVTLPGLPGMGP